MCNSKFFVRGGALGLLRFFTSLRLLEVRENLEFVNAEAHRDALKPGAIAALMGPLAQADRSSAFVYAEEQKEAATQAVVVSR